MPEEVQGAQEVEVNMNNLNPTETITFICGVIMCVIGISTFVSALLTRARKDGQIEYKVDSALKGIDEIKDSIKSHNNWQESMSIKVESHEEKIESLFRKYSEMRKDIDETHKEINAMLLKERK